MQLAHLMVVGEGTDGLEVGAALVAVTSAMILPHSARGVLVEVATTMVEAAVVVMVVPPLHTVVVDMVALGLLVLGIDVIVVAP